MTDGSDEHQEAAVNGQRTAEGPRPRRGFWFGLVVAIVKPFMLTFTKQEFPGRENVPRSGGVVFVTNHISHFDPFVLGFYIWECRRIPRLLGKASLFKLPIARPDHHQRRPDPGVPRLGRGRRRLPGRRRRGREGRVRRRLSRRARSPATRTCGR